MKKITIIAAAIVLMGWFWTATFLAGAGVFGLAFAGGDNIYQYPGIQTDFSFHQPQYVAPLPEYTRQALENLNREEQRDMMRAPTNVYIDQDEPEIINWLNSDGTYEQVIRW